MHLKSVFFLVVFKQLVAPQLPVQSDQIRIRNTLLIPERGSWVNYFVGSS